PGVADRPLVRAGLHGSDHGARDHQYLREIPQPRQGPLIGMAAVLSTRQKVVNRTAIAAVVLLTLVYLVPIYWITSTAFKPRSLATTVPPTVLFEPEATAFIKVFTKRV